MTLTVLYTSDVHGNVLPKLYGNNEKAELGLAKYASAVKRKRLQNNPLIVIDNGDLIQGTPLMTHYVKEHQEKENPMVGIMNRINIDAGVIGNHEFNFGKKVLQQAVEASNYPWLSANIVDAVTKEPKFGPPYIIKTLDQGIKIAIVGVTTHYIPNWEAPKHIEGIDFLDAYSTLKHWVNVIKEEENPDLLIACYHGGLEKDPVTGEATEALTGENQGYKMCTEIKGIDILLTGHQHRTFVEKINGTLVLQPGSSCQFYGEVTVTFAKQERKWKPIHKEGKLHSLEQFEADDEILSYIETLETSTQRWLDKPIGYVNGDMTITDPFQARVRKHPFIEFIHKVQMEASGADISVASLLNNHSAGFSSVVTMRDIVSNYMYPNTLVVLELTGKDIKEALEKSAEYFVLDNDGEIAVNPVFAKPKPQHYNYDMWEGIEYEIRVSEPFGSRVRHITYHGKPLKEDQTYHVVLNNYRASGGGNFKMFQQKPIVKEIQKDMVELIREYFEKYETVTATVHENFAVKK